MTNFFGKLQQMQQKMDEIKSRLDHVTVEGTAGNGQVRITLTGNREVKRLHIADELVRPEKKQELTDYLEIALADALEQAENTGRAEMRAAGKDILPGLPGF